LREAMERAREKKGGKKEAKSLIERLMGGAPKDDSVKKHGVLPDVYIKSLRGPTTSSLNGGEICASFCKRSGAARSK
jgi:hypothetical protein